MTLANALPSVLGDRLKILGLNGGGQAAAIVKVLHQHAAFKATEFRGLGVTNEHATQWQRVHDAWKLMASHEDKVGLKYDLVLKLRFDCTPLQTLNFCGTSEALEEASSNNNGTFRAVHACTDHAYWGRREVMEVAAFGTFLAIESYFLRERRNPLQRHFSVSATLGSLVAVPSYLWGSKLGRGSGPWRHYNKVGTVPYLNMHVVETAGQQRNGHETMIVNLLAAKQQGMEMIDPLETGLPRSVDVVKGYQANPHDYKDGAFVTEKVWPFSPHVCPPTHSFIHPPPPPPFTYPPLPLMFHFVLSHLRTSYRGCFETG
jgi:hypothetical protein